MISIARAGFGTSIDAAEVAADVATQTELETFGDQYRVVHAGDALIGIDFSAGTYLFSASHPTAAQATGAISGGDKNSRTMPFFYWDDADYAVSGQTVKLRLRAQVATNATAPTNSFVIGLHSVTVAGTADTIGFTAGAVVTGSGVTHTTPGASGIVSGVTADFTVPADGAYCLAVVTDGTIANNAMAQCSAQLQVRAS